MSIEVNLPATVTPADLLIALSSEDDESVLDFILDLDLSMQSYEFTEELIKRLKASLGESEDEESGDGWIKWKGGKCPLPRGTLVDVEFRNGRRGYELPADMTSARHSNDASDAFWRHDGMSNDIVAYRVS